MEAKSFNLLEQQDVVRKIADDPENRSFFILNTTDKPNKSGKATRDPGTLLFTVMAPGGAKVVRVPVSWVPVDASQQATKQQIVDSAEFQRALSSGSIMIMTDRQGRSIIEADAASGEEYSKVMAKALQVNGSEDSFGYTDNTDRTEDGELDPWANVSAEVKINVEEMQEGAMDEAQFASFLRRSARSISDLDHKYIAEKLPSLSSSGTSR